jgi:hypothetical protein
MAVLASGTTDVWNLWGKEEGLVRGCEHVVEHLNLAGMRQALELLGVRISVRLVEAFSPSLLLPR